ncbi:MAG: hypothetical protein KC766_09780 [Myxococcales bacterium]|nr:hypothetical protein [Myxococcales bacterium]
MCNEYEDQFRAFHKANPRVYEAIVAKTRREVAANRTPGIRRIWEELRQEGFRMDDHFHAYYARMVMAREPDLRGVFRIRQTASPKRRPN